MLQLCRILFVILILCAVVTTSTGTTTNERQLRVAVLDFGELQTGHRAAEKLFLALSSNNDLLMIDRDESRAAALGLGYKGSLNMTLQEARDLGAAIGCDFYITGDAQTLRRSPSTGTVYYEAYASVFLISARTGRLIKWDRPSFEAASPAEAELTLLKELNQRAAQYADAIRTAQELERGERALALARAADSVSVIEDAPDDEAAAARAGLRLPQPYRRLRPAYPETAARAEAEATVDVQLEIDREGEVSSVEIVRWAGFGLDEATISTVRQLHFRPAMRDGQAVPIRVLLRYNFRRPPK